MLISNVGSNYRRIHKICNQLNDGLEGPAQASQLSSWSMSSLSLSYTGEHPLAINRPCPSTHFKNTKPAEGKGKQQ